MKAGDILIGQLDALFQCFERGIQIRNVFRYQGQGEAGLVLGQDNSVAIINQATGRGDG